MNSRNMFDARRSAVPRLSLTSAVLGLAIMSVLADWQANKAFACDSRDPRCIPTPQYSRGGGSYSGSSGSYRTYSGGGGGGYNYGAAIGAAGALIEAAPVVIDLLGGLLSTGTDVVSGLSSAGGDILSSGANAVSNVVPSAGPESNTGSTSSGFTLPMPFRLFSPETAQADDALPQRIPDCLKKSGLSSTKSSGQFSFRPLNACNDSVTIKYNYCPDITYDRDPRRGDYICKDGSTTIGKGVGHAIDLSYGRPKLLSVCNSQGQCHSPAGSTAARPAPKPKEQRSAEARTQAERPVQNTPLLDTVKSFHESLQVTP